MYAQELADWQGDHVPVGILAPVAYLFSTSQNAVYRPSGYNRFLDYWWYERGGVTALSRKIYMNLEIYPTRRYGM
jgi:hypothetical protein